MLGGFGLLIVYYCGLLIVYYCGLLIVYYCGLLVVGLLKILAAWREFSDSKEFIYAECYTVSVHYCGVCDSMACRNHYQIRKIRRQAKSNDMRGNLRRLPYNYRSDGLDSFCD